MNFAIIGNPVEHSLSPALHNWVFDHLGLEAHYTKLLVNKDDLPLITKKLKNGEFDGINVTIPHKQDIILYLDDLDNRARQINAVNCVVKDKDKLVGFNTDWYGFTKMLHINNIEVSERTCVVLGAGGAARSVVYSLIKEGAKEIFIVNRNLEKARNVLASFGNMTTKTSLQTAPFTGLTEILPDKIVIVNCTPVGMIPDINTTPFKQKVFHKDQIIIDLIYTPLKTLLLQSGDKQGAQTINGLDMFIFQALASLDLWFDTRISKMINHEELVEYIVKSIENSHYNY